MEPWYKVSTPRKEVREGRSFNPDEFAIALEQVVDGTAPEDYKNPSNKGDVGSKTTCEIYILVPSLKKLALFKCGFWNPECGIKPKFKAESSKLKAKQSLLTSF